MAKNEIVDLLLKEPVGIIVACNIVKTLEEGLINDKSKVKEFMGNVLEAFEEEASTDPIEETKALVALLGEVAAGIAPESSKKRPFLFLCDKHTDNLDDTETFSTVLTVRILKDYLLTDSVLLDSHVSVLSNPYSSDESLKDAIEALNEKLKSDPGVYKSNAMLGGHDPRPPLLWITPSASIDSKRRPDTYKGLGDGIRDLLGLIHLRPNSRNKDNALVEILIPGRKLNDRTHVCPTFADAVEHTRFKVCSDSPVKNLKWGLTVDMQQLQERKPKIAGAKERVVDGIRFEKGLEAKLQFCGFIETTRGESHNDNDTVFAVRLCSDANMMKLKGIDTAKLKNTLLGLFP